jgi:hypothetical protein
MQLPYIAGMIVWRRHPCDVGRVNLKSDVPAPPMR